MLTAREVALRVNGLQVTRARVRRGKKGPELIITDPLLGDFAVDERFTLELLELLVSPEMRQRLPNDGWRKVSLRILIVLLRSGVVRIAEESRTTRSWLGQVAARVWSVGHGRRRWGAGSFLFARYPRTTQRCRGGGTITKMTAILIGSSGRAAIDNL